MKVFLTGGTGFIGQPLTQSLLRRGWKVTALVRKPDSPQAQVIRHMGATLAMGDVTNRESMRAAMNGADTVIHNAGYYEFGLDTAGQQRARAINVQGTENVFSLALELGIVRSIHISTTWAYGDCGPELHDETFTRTAPYHSVYEQTKAEAHAIAHQYQQRGLPLVIVCPNGVMGPNDHSVWGYFLRLYINHLMPPMAWSPHSVFSLVEVRDLAEGIALAAEKGRLGETYFLCGESKSLSEHFRYWAERPGGFKHRLWVPPTLAQLAFWPLEPLQRAAGLPAFMSRETVLAAACNLNYSSEKAKRELGWMHKTAREMWLGTIDEELELLAKRRNRSLVARLKPMESEA
jgi:dihydroflavonol-4-reductase